MTTTENEDKQATKKQLKRAANWGFLLVLLWSGAWFGYSIPVEGPVLANGIGILGLLLLGISMLFKIQVKWMLTQVLRLALFVAAAHSMSALICEYSAHDAGHSEAASLSQR
jgi:hypothetical protein